MVRLLVSLVTVVLVAVLGGCQAGDGQPAPTGSWRLVSFAGPFAPEPGDPSVTSTIELSEGAVTGFGGVNNLTGTYRRTASGSLEFPDLAVTEKAGSPAAMNQEAKFVAALRATRRYEVVGDELVLSRENNDTLMTLRR